MTDPTVREYLMNFFQIHTGKHNIDDAQLEQYICLFEGVDLTLLGAHMLTRDDFANRFNIIFGHAMLLEIAFRNCYNGNNVNNTIINNNPSNNQNNVNNNINNINNDNNNQSSINEFLSALVAAVNSNPNSLKRQGARRIPKQEEQEIIEILDDDVPIKEEDQSDNKEGEEGISNRGNSGRNNDETRRSSTSLGVQQSNVAASGSRRQRRDGDSYTVQKKLRVDAYNNNNNASIGNNNLTGQSSEAEINNMRQTLAKLMNNRSYNPNDLFNQPVDPVADNVPDYLENITRPMDLGTVEKNLNNGHYQSQAQVCADIRLVFGNAMSYNPPSHHVYHAAEQLQKIFDRECKRLGSSADDGNANKKKSKGKASNHKGRWSDDEKTKFFTYFPIYRNNWKKFEEVLEGRNSYKIKEWAKRAFVNNPKKRKQKGFDLLFNNQVSNEEEFDKLWSEFSAYYERENGFVVPQPEHTTSTGDYLTGQENHHEEGERDLEQGRETATVGDDDVDYTGGGGDNYDYNDHSHHDDQEGGMCKDPSMEQWGKLMEREDSH